MRNLHLISVAWSAANILFVYSSFMLSCVAQMARLGTILDWIDLISSVKPGSKDRQHTVNNFGFAPFIPALPTPSF